MTAEPPATGQSSLTSHSPLTWTDDGQPRSSLFGDVYFSAQDGLAETRAVFLDGCHLPDAWTNRRRFVVGELGFGTGLNIVALLDLWRRSRPRDAQLHIFSIEAFPITAAEARRALSRWPELWDIADLLTARWPGRARGRHRVDLPEFGAILDLSVMEAAEALAEWSGPADAWFLDGFSPALNPQMWSDEVLGLVAQRSAPGARAATFTVAGQVRRGLAAAGFAVDKRPGFGRKRERLEAWLPGDAADPRARHIAIVGGGVAGAAAARACRALGATAIVIEAERPGAGGSGNPGALVTPRLDAALGDAARLQAQAFGRAVSLYDEVPGAVLSRGVLQFAGDARDAGRFGKIAASDVFEPEALTLLDAEAATARMGEAAPPALDQATSLVIEPAPILAAWTGETVVARVASLERGPEGWRLLDDAGREIARADAVIIAAALGSAGLNPTLALQPVRGQASWTLEKVQVPAAAWGGYVLETRDGLLFGATHDRDDTGVEVRPADHDRNLATLAAALPALHARIASAPLDGRAAIRAATPDRMPLAGELAPGLFALTGFGSRGFSQAPLLAEHVAALAVGAPSPIGRGQAQFIAPDRFARRAARRRS